MWTTEVLSNKDFVKLWISQATSQFALNVVNFLILFKLFTSTSSTIAVSFLWLAYSIPALLVGPIAATLVDYVNKKKILIITNILQAIVILLYLPIKERFFLIYGVVFIYSFLNQFYMPAESASIPKLVKKGSLPQANGLFVLTVQSSVLVGFGLGGFINKYLGTEAGFLLCSALLLIASLACFSLPKLEVRGKIQLEAGIESFFKKVVDGYLFIKNNNRVLFPFLLLTGMQIVSTVIVVNVPALATEVFGMSINDASLALVVPGAFGAILGTFSVPRLLAKGIRKRVIIERSVLLSVAIILLVVFVVGALDGVAKGLMISGVAFFSGTVFIGIIVPAQTFLQEVTPGGLRGRIFGSLWFIITLATIAPLLLSATITELVGVRMLFLVIASLACFVFIYSRHFADSALSVEVKK